MKWCRTVFLSAFACLLAGSGFADTVWPAVDTRQGAISGIEIAPTLHEFLGVPFAAPPVGDLRWRAPRESAAWSGVRPATQFAPGCMQPPAAPALGGGAAPGPGFSEDCLYLNVWTPAASPAAKLPVLVWIYGGGFQAGNTAIAKYRGENLARKGVVLVSIAYRLGALGFLAHPALTRESPHRASGNYGILDQIAALTWIKNNIAGFGGDPANVTVFGESAGSTAINILQASPLAKNLFGRAIGESTSEMDASLGLPGRQSLAQAEQAGLAYQKDLGAHSLAELRALPADKLFSATAKFWPIEKDGYVLPLDVYTTFATGRQNPADILVGANADEGAILRLNWIKPETEKEKSGFGALYGEEAGPTRQSDSDAVLWQMWSWAKLNAQMPGRKSYLYWFDQTAPVLPGQPARMAGPIHGAEIIYVFDNLATRPAPWTEEDRRVAEMMASYWTNFAKTGNPNGAGLPEWPAFDAKDPRVIAFGGTAKPIAMPRADGVTFIDSYFARRRAGGQ